MLAERLPLAMGDSDSRAFDARSGHVLWQHELG